MTKYKVTIRGTVTKTIEVEANDASEAEEDANEMFNLSIDGRDEQYERGEWRAHGTMVAGTIESDQRFGAGPLLAWWDYR